MVFYPTAMNPSATSRLFFWSLVSALAGFLFGFDTVVISGAEKTIQSLWSLSDGLHGFAMDSALYGTVIGSLCGWLAVWGTIRLVRTRTFMPFVVYRIGLGVLVLALIVTGVR